MGQARDKETGVEEMTESSNVVTDEEFNLARLEQEILNQKGALVTALTNRRDHPTYGYTKAAVKERLAILFGMVQAWAYVTGVLDKPGMFLFDAEMNQKINAAFNFDLRNLVNQVGAC